METLEMVAKALESVVEQKVAEKAGTVNLDSILEFIKSADRDSLNQMLIAIGETSIGDNLIKDIVDRAIEDDDDVIMKDDIDVDLIDDMGLLNDCFERYVLNGDVREIVKDLIDEI